MDAGDIHLAAKEIAARLHIIGLARIDFEMVRAAVAGYCIGASIAGHMATGQQIEDLENLALRKVVEACA